MTLFFIGFMTLRLLLAAIFFLVLYKVIVLIRRKTGNHEGKRENRGIMILKERLASGEIDEARYHNMIEVLKD
jgi:uncharacterized membrane protein